MNRKRAACRAIAVVVLLTACSFIIPTRLATAQTCGAAGCTSGPTHYNTNQGGNAYYCQNSSANDPYLAVPANTNTVVAADNAGPATFEPWNYGVTGQVLIANPDIVNTATITMTTYIGDQAVCNNMPLSCYYALPVTVTLAPGEAAWLPFTTLSVLNNPNDYYAFYVALETDDSNGLRCYAESYYTFEHD